MASHGVPRAAPLARSEEQIKDEAKKIENYRRLEDDIRNRVAVGDYSRDTFKATTELIHLNPEYYTIWNVRRRCITSDWFSGSSSGYASWMASQNTLPTDTTSLSTGGSSVPSSLETQCNPKNQPTGPPGTTADAAWKAAWNALDGSETAASGIVANTLQFIESELRETIGYLKKFPKCYWLWFHRTWILSKAIELLPPKIARRIWLAELKLDTMMLGMDRRNFHAWGYRKNVVEHLESEDLGGSSMVREEFEFTTSMIKVDLSNFSAWHRRATLLSRLLNEINATDVVRKEYFDKELELVLNALNVGPEDQSLWFYHQFLMMSVASSNPRHSIVPNLSADERQSIIDEQISQIEDLLEDYENVKWLYEALIEYLPHRASIGRRNFTEEEIGQMKEFLSKLEELDPLRKGRWLDIRETLRL